MLCLGEREMHAEDIAFHHAVVGVRLECGEDGVRHFRPPARVERIGSKILRLHAEHYGPSAIVNVALQAAIPTRAFAPGRFAPRAKLRRKQQPNSPP